MKKAEKIQLLLEYHPWLEEAELKKMKVAEIDALMDELDDESVLYPNGRDYDAEDEDWP